MGELILKVIPPEDYATYRDLINNPNVTRMTGSIPYPVTMEFVEKRLAGRARQEAEERTIAERGFYVDGVLVGSGSYFPDDDGKCAIGYSIGEEYWGKGYATAAAKAIIAMAREHGNMGVLYADHAKDNPASGRVLEKLGFVVVGDGMMKSAGRDEPNEVWKLELPAVTMVDGALSADAD